MGGGAAAAIHVERPVPASAPTHRVCGDEGAVGRRVAGASKAPKEGRGEMSDQKWMCVQALRVAVLGVVLCAVPLSAGAQTTPPWAQQVNEKWYAAYNAGDAPALAKLYLADAVILLPDQTVKGRPAIETYQGGNFKKTGYACTWAIDGVQVAGRQAAVLGHDSCVETPKAGGAPKTVKSRWLTVFERQADGSWMIARDASEEIKP